MPFRVTLQAGDGPHEIEVPSFDAAIDAAIDALGSDVHLLSVKSHKGARFEPEVIERAIRKRLSSRDTRHPDRR